MANEVIYDVHTHVGMDLAFFLSGWWPYAASARDLLDRMDVVGVRRAVCCPFTVPTAFDPFTFADRGELVLLPDRFPFDRENALLADELAKFDSDGRLAMLAMFDPSRCLPAQLVSLEKLVGRIAGLKVQTTVLRSSIRDLLGPARDVLAFAEQHDLPVLIHTAVYPEDRWAQVTDCLAVAEAFPRVRFDLAHSLRFDRESLRRAADMDNVWVDCAAHLAHCHLACQDAPFVAGAGRRVEADYRRPADVLEAIHELLGGRFMWGSDHPFMSWCDNVLDLIYTYQAEAEVLHALPAPVRASMACTAPEAWLYGSKGDTP